MFKPLISFAAAVALTAAPALAGGSEQHSAQSVFHSGQASSHSSAAVSSGVATVLAAPIIVFGAGVSITGAGLAGSGAASVALGNDLARSGERQKPQEQVVRPDGAPRLD